MAYNPVIPEIAKAFENDPRTKIAASLMQMGGNTAPVAAGKYAWGDGIARALSGVAGAYITKRQQKKFGEREKDYQTALAAALAGGQADPSGQVVPPVDSMPAIGGFNRDAAMQGQSGFAATPPMAPPAAGPVDLAAMRAPQAPSSAPLQAIDPNTALNGPQTPPVAPAQAQNMAAALGAPQPQAAPQMRPPLAPARSMEPPAMARPSSDYFMNGIVPIEGGTDKAGRFRTSPAGAIGPAQVMPTTAPYAAKLAGVPFNEKLYRSDAAYNLKLGQAYYDKMLDTFGGDPVKAAAAYNAGPGSDRTGRRGVKGAIRAAAKAGDSDNWVAFLPAETRKYVANFSARFEGDTSNAVADEAAPVQAARQMEQVAPAPEAVARPNAPQVPQAVQSERLAIAKRLLQSGNADLVSLAQGYLDTGLTENFQANTQRNSQEFQQGQTGYQSDLNDFTSARSDARQDRYQTNRDITARNFDREQQEDAQGYGTAERLAGDKQRMRELQYGRAASKELAELNNSAEWRRTQAQIDASAATREEKAAAKRDAFFNTAVGARQYKEATDRISGNDATIQKLDEIEEIVNRNRTGGLLATPVVGSVVSAFNDDYATMRAKVNEITINDSTILKGALSDSDRSFVLKAQPNEAIGNKANLRIINAKRNALRRTNDFEVARLEATAAGNQVGFLREWSEYKKAVSVDPTKNKGGYKSFDEWRTPTKSYDTAGNEIQ